MGFQHESNQRNENEFSNGALLRPIHPHLQPVNILVRGDEDQVAVFPAESDVRGPRLGHVDVFAKIIFDPHVT
jgi:hypothetical protein